MAGDADLACQYDVPADLGAASQADLSTEQCVFAHSGCVSDLDKVVYFGAAADTGFTTVARSIVAFAPTSTSSSITTMPDWRIL